jgi:hypothetical protein
LSKAALRAGGRLETFESEATARHLRALFVYDVQTFLLPEKVESFTSSSSIHSTFPCEFKVLIKIYISPGWKVSRVPERGFPLLHVFYGSPSVVILAIAGFSELGRPECVSCLINNFYDTFMSY